MDAHGLSKSTAPGPEDSPVRAVHRLRGKWLGLCCWSILIVAALLVGWVAARAARTRNAATTAAVAPPSPTAAAPAPETGLRFTSAKLMTASIPPDLPDALGDALDAPRWDVQEKAVREVRAERDVPESERWQISFPEGTTEAEYARQLAALELELGVVRSDGTIEYLANPGDAVPQRRTAQRADEKRAYWTWSRGSLVKADRSLLKKAGIDVGADDVILHLWSPATAERRAKLEQEYKGRKPRDVFLTRFALKRTFRGYEVYVQEQVGR